MNPPSVDVKDMLEAESILGLDIATDLFVGEEPITPDNCVTIFDTPGFAPQLTLTPGEDYFYPSIQIRVRNRDYRTGWTLANNIKTVLHGKAQETWNGTLYSVIYCSSGTALLDRDEKRRARFVINFNLQRRDA
jgi:hypothetical protein